MGPDGSWLVTCEADANKATPWDESRAEAFDQFADAVRGIGPTPSLESRRGPKLLASVPNEFGEAFAADLAPTCYESHPRVEIHLGGWKVEGGSRVRKASSYIAAPSECNGVERVAIDPTLEVAQLPDRLLAELAEISLDASARKLQEAVERAERRAAGLLELDDLDDEEQAAWEAFRVETLLADFERLGPAIAGEHGHDRTFSAAAMVIESGVEDESEQLDLMLTYNEGCDPEWSESELEHKLRSAAERVGDRRDREDRYLAMFRAARRREASGPSRGMWVPSGRTARVG